MIRGVVISPKDCVRRISFIQSSIPALRRTVENTAWNNRNFCWTSNAFRPYSVWSRLWIQDKKELMFQNIIVLSRLCTQQCNFVASQRLRRAYGIWCLHRQLYSDLALKRMVSKLGRRLVQQRPLGVLLGAALFNWEKENIQDDELERCACDLLEVEKLLGKQLPNSQGIKAANCESRDMKAWELVINKDHLKVWRKSVDNTRLYEYKVFGTYYDITPRSFFQVQVDMEYRKKWDNLVIKLDIVERLDEKNKPNSASEVVHWVMHYPYPMYSRDYVYVRRYLVDEENKLMVFVSRSTEHPAVPVQPSYVRVARYKSQMVIRPHASFDNNGFDYVLTYFDDPHAIFPGPAYNWLASSGVPDFVNKLHSAAKTLLTIEDKQGDSDQYDFDSTEAAEPHSKRKRRWKLHVTR